MSEESPIALNAAQMMFGGALLFILSSATEDVHLEFLLSDSRFPALSDRDRFHGRTYFVLLARSQDEPDLPIHMALYFSSDCCRGRRAILL